MRYKIDNIQKDINKRTIYNFYSAKEIYLARTPSKVLLLEKKSNIKPSIKSISLSSRNTVVVNKKTGILLFPDNK